MMNMLEVVTVCGLAMAVLMPAGVASAAVDTNPNGHPAHPTQPVDTETSSPGSCNANSSRPADNFDCPPLP